MMIGGATGVIGSALVYFIVHDNLHDLACLSLQPTLGLWKTYGMAISALVAAFIYAVVRALLLQKRPPET